MRGGKGIEIMEEGKEEKRGKNIFICYDTQTVRITIVTFTANSNKSLLSQDGNAKETPCVQGETVFAIYLQNRRNLDVAAELFRLNESATKSWSKISIMLNNRCVSEEWYDSLSN